MKAAIFLPNWLGDLVMATPVLRALRRKFGDRARLVGIMRPYLADVLSGTKWLDEQWYFDPWATDSALRAWSVANRMRRERFDLAVLLTNSFRPALMAWWAGAKQRVGYVRYGRGPLLTCKLHPRRLDGKIMPEPVVESYLTIADALGCGNESYKLELAVSAPDEQSADGVFRRLGIRQDGRLILLNSGSAGSTARLWPVEYFGLLARRLITQCDHDVLVMCGPKERDMANDVVKYANSPRAFSMADQPLDFGTAKACIRCGRLMISTDSGPRHVAAALGVPVITFYGPTPPIWSANPSQRAIDLKLELDCIGCRKRTCPLGHHRCMRDLSVDMAFASVVKMLESCPPIAQLQNVAGIGDSEYQALPAPPHFPTFIGQSNLFGTNQETISRH